MQNNVKHQILQCLDKHNLSPGYVLYVSYAVGPTLQSIKKYTCNLDSFLDIVQHITSAFNLAWPFVLRIVGKDFWIEWDYRGEWILHTYPKVEGPYKCPSTEDLIRQEYDETRL